jgi:hypothetical protein
MDETFFASITQSLLEKGTFSASIAPYVPDSKSLYLYGPAYFTLTAMSIKLFGFGMVQFRIVCLIFGLMLLPLLYKIFQWHFKDNSLAFYCTFLFMFDPVFNSSLHEGRMDTMAMFFVFAALYSWMCFFDLCNGRGHYHRLVLSGTLLAIAILTSPRVLFIALTFLCPLFFFYSKKASIKIYLSNMLFMAIFPVFSMMAWVLYAHGSFYSFLIYVTKYHAASHAFSPGFKQWIFPLNIPLICLTLFLLGLNLIKKTGKIQLFAYISLLSILIFHVFIKGGFYIIFVLPFYYLLFVEGVKKIFKNRLLNHFFIGGILIFNIVIFGARTYACFNDQPNYKVVATIFKNSIPKGSKIIGDEKFYYEAVKAGNDFESINISWQTTTGKRELYQRSTFEYDYVVCELNPSNAELNYYNTKSRFDTILAHHFPSPNPVIEVTQKNLKNIFSFNKKNRDFIVLKRKAE